MPEAVNLRGTGMEVNLQTVNIKGLSAVAGSAAGAAVFSLWEKLYILPRKGNQNLELKH